MIEKNSHMQSDEAVQQPLRSLKVVEFEGIGPGPLAGRMLADLGAHVTGVARPTPSPLDRTVIGENNENPLRQGKQTIVLDLKTADGAALDLVADADALIEGYRPGVMERLGLGPAECAAQCTPGLRTHDRMGAEWTLGFAVSLGETRRRPHCSADRSR
jgi:alpha-methylacyl-CoA racemase